MVDRVMKGGGAKPGMKKTLSVKANIMTPVKPMLVGKFCPPHVHVMNCDFIG